VVVAVAFGVQRTVASAGATRAEWSAGPSVVVVRRSVDAGAELVPTDVTAARRPRAVVPVDALSEVPGGAIAAVRLSPGTVLTPALLERERRSPTARALRAGRVAVVVRTGDLPRLATRGDVVDVASPNWDEPVAAGAEVLDVDGDAVTLAVDEDDTAATAAASPTGPVAVVVRP
jgi:Flp pilus assembly protein CpaB